MRGRQRLQQIHGGVDTAETAGYTRDRPAILARMVPRTRVRAVGANELHDLHAIRLRALRESPGAFGSTFAAESARDPASRLAWVVEGVVLVAEDAEGWHGLAAARIDDDDRGLVGIVSMWVAPERRGQGLGTALLFGVLDWARAGGATRARLGVVEHNRAAWSLYRAHGFVPTGEREPLASDPTRDVVYLTVSLRSRMSSRPR